MPPTRQEGGGLRGAIAYPDVLPSSSLNCYRGIPLPAGRKPLHFWEHPNNGFPI